MQDPAAAPRRVASVRVRRPIETERWLTPLVLVVLVFAVYYRTLGYPFINYDDNTYVTHNVHLRQGWAHVMTWAFGLHAYAGNWHPLTWISHLLDYQLHGLARPGGHHLTNVILHAANAALLFLVLRRMKLAWGPSAFVAAFFALHPLRVESVAWVAERKDVLSGFFWIATMGAYVLYTERSSPARYALVMLGLMLGLGAKPMVVTLPFALLLLDEWPLRRPLPWRRRILEKLPLVAVAGVASIFTVIAQSRGGAVGSLEQLPLAERLGNALVSYVAYLGKAIAPRALAPLYPLPAAGWAAWQVLGSALLLCGISVWTFLQRTRHRYLWIGWLWYLGTLVPVIGILHVGTQSFADRYTYLPLIGPTLALAFWTAERFGGSPSEAKAGSRRQRSESRARSGAMAVVGAAAVVVLVVMASLSWRQVSRWRDTETLFLHTARVTAGNATAENVLGATFLEQQRVAEAIQHLSRAISMAPRMADAHNNLGLALTKQGDVAAALREFETALRLDPKFAEASANLGMSYYVRNDIERAFTYCAQALRLDPGMARAHNTMAAIEWARGRRPAAVASWRRAAELEPDLADPHRNLAIAYHALGQDDAAWREIGEFERRGGVTDSALRSQVLAGRNASRR